MPPIDSRGPRIFSAVRHNPRAWVTLSAAVVFIVLSAVAVGTGMSVGAQRTAAVAATTPRPTASSVASPAPSTARPTPAAPAAASKVRTCSVDSLAADPRLGTLEAQVVNASTGEVLFDRNGSTPAATASVMKVLTSAAALSALGPNYQIPTRVVQTGPGSIALIGGGDVTLSRLPDGQQPFYTNAPHLTDLAQATLAAWQQKNPGQAIQNISIDATLFGQPVWQPSWDENEERVIQGSTSYVTALQVDGDRANPTAVESPRSTTPIQNAANDFVGDLGLSGKANVTYATSPTPTSDPQLAQVLSQPVSALINQAMTYSDNTIMESLARLVAIKEGTGNTFSAENAGTTKALAAYGIPTTGLTIVDGSGLSADNRVPPSYLTQLFIKVLNQTNGLGVVYNSLPIAGQTGTLGPGYSRFQGSSAIARGHVFAKTGWIDTGYTLAGIIKSADGTPLTFAIFAEGNVSDNAKAAIDSLTAGIYSCGNNLSNN